MNLPSGLENYYMIKRMFTFRIKQLDVFYLIDFLIMILLMMMKVFNCLNVSYNFVLMH